MMGSFTELSYTSVSEIPSIINTLNQSFLDGKTQLTLWRKNQLKQLWRMLDEHEAAFQDALFHDSGKLKLEAQLFELSLVKNDILHLLQELDVWLEPEVVSVPPPFQFWQPTVHKQPKGTCLIIAPWNYPICLTMLPLAGMIASGNTSIIKPRYDTRLPPLCHPVDVQLRLT
jgi:aldehyde dehydrogenase (NAD+)